MMITAVSILSFSLFGPIANPHYNLNCVGLSRGRVSILNLYMNE
jgi:hypothetical protein